MGFNQTANAVGVDIVSNANITSTGGSTTGLDIKNADGVILATLNARASGTGAMTVTVEHSYDNSSWATVDAGDIVDPNTGDADSFDAVSTTAYEQTVGLIAMNLRRYVRLTFAGSGLDHNVAVVFVYPKKYTTG